MRFWDWISRFFESENETLRKRVDELEIQLKAVKSDLEKQLADLRLLSITTHAAEKPKPVAARTMADVRRFLAQGENEDA